MICLQELLHDPDFCDTFQIRSKRSTWVEGKQVSTTTTRTVIGIVLPSSSQDVDMLPEGDRRHGMKTFYAEISFRVTDTEETSDVCVFRGKQYKLLQVFDYQSNGFYKAIGTLMGDDDDL